ncbi:MAG: hypothetical protein ACETWD_08915 [Desulfatiglandales bacterium]
MSKFLDILEKARNERKNLVNRKLDLQAIQEWDRLIQDLQDREEQLHQTIATLEAARKASTQESSELKRQLQESKSRLQVLSEEMTAWDKRLDEVNQAHQALAEQLKTEIQEKAVRVSNLENEIEGLKGGYQQKAQTFDEDEILKGLTKERRNRMTKKLLEELLTRSRPIHSKVTCPRCKENISVRFRLGLKSKERDANKRKELIEEIKKPS